MGGTGSGDWEGATWVEFNFWRRSFKGIKFLMLVDLAKLLRGGDRERATGRGQPGGGLGRGLGGHKNCLSPVMPMLT